VSWLRKIAAQKLSAMQTICASFMALKQKAHKAPFCDELSSFMALKQKAHKAPFCDELYCLLVVTATVTFLQVSWLRKIAPFYCDVSCLLVVTPTRHFTHRLWRGCN